MDIFSPQVHGLTDTSVQHCAHGVNAPLQACPDFGLCHRGIVKSPVRHIVRCETRGKVVRVMTLAAHNPFMELHAVDFDRNQSDSMELAMESSVRH